MNLEQKLEAIIKPICDRMELVLMDVKVKGDRKNMIFRIFADNEKGITLGECGTLTRSVQDEIDMDESFGVSYRLDVSSPGVGHPLKFEFEYKKNIGRTLIVSVSDDGENKVHEGILKSFNEEFLTLESPKGESKLVRKTIQQAKVKVQW